VKKEEPFIISYVSNTKDIKRILITMPYAMECDFLFKEQLRELIYEKYPPLNIATIPVNTAINFGKFENSNTNGGYQNLKEFEASHCSPYYSPLPYGKYFVIDEPPDDIVLDFISDDTNFM